ncbi:MAG: energy-coupling factor transporter transmembrane protein EcfT, partial [Actinomycetota bacterium]|nr:energy-coupling factor transporter transmembrane protein EcfT [Actinomycetota bacterium]
FVTASVDPGALHLAGPLVVPPVPWLPVAGVALALLPAVAAPAPPRARDPRPRAEKPTEKVAA